MLILMLSSATTIAESLPNNAMIYEHPTDPLVVYSFTPLADGSIVLAGQLRHAGQYRDMPDHVGYEHKEMEVLNDAAAVCLAPDGTKRWEIRLADPQAENNFYCRGILPDGRLLMRFAAFDSTSFGSHNFIVNQDGVVEEMLPTSKIAETASPLGITVMPGGYLTDGARYVDAIYGTDYPSSIIMRDFDGNELWRYDYRGDAIYEHIGSITERPDGFIICGESEEWDINAKRVSWIAKLDRDGEVLWHTTYPTLSFGLSFPCFLEDGGMIFTGYYDPGHPALIKLDDNGKLVWSIPIDDLVGIGGVTTVGDGYVLTGTMDVDAMIHDYLLLYVDAEGKTIGTLPITGDGGLVPWWPQLLKDENGDIYVYANLAEPDNAETRMSGDVKKFFYAKIDEDSFR